MTLTTYLVQRFRAAPENPRVAKATQVFGGEALLLRDEAWRLIQSVVDIEMMGAAEYEFGRLGTCLGAIYDNRARYECWDFTVRAEDIPPAWWRKNAIQELRHEELAEAKKTGTKAPRMTPKHREILEARARVCPLQDLRIFVFSAHPREDVQNLISDVGTGKMRCKREAGFYLDPDPRHPRRTVGWLDLENNLAWFSSMDTRDTFAEMLGVPAGAAMRRDATFLSR